MQSVTQSTSNHSIFSYAFHFETVRRSSSNYGLPVGHVQRRPPYCKPKKGTKVEFTDNWPDRRPGIKWGEGVNDDAVRILRCRSWKLPEQNGTFWRQNVWEVKG